MRARVTPSAGWRYATPAIVLHWAIALLFVFLAALGWYMTREDGPDPRWFMDLHKSAGLAAFALVLVRVSWRLGHPPAPLPYRIPRWQAWLATGVQCGLYVLMLLVPFTGVIGAGYQRARVAFFGLGLPRWTPPNSRLADDVFQVHEALIWIMVALVALHAGAALFHALVLKDGVFRRMWLARRRAARS